MKKYAFMFSAYLLGINQVAFAQFSPHVGEIPPTGEKTTVTVGGNLYETYNYSVAPGLLIDDEMKVEQNKTTQIRIPAKTILFIYRDDKRPKACVAVPTPALYDNPCAIDMDNDGDFDRLAANEVAGAKDLVPSIPYVRGKDFVSTVGAGSFKNSLIYQGIAKGVMRVSYREFVNDMARPAFTEEYTLEVGEQLPQDLSIRNQKFTIIDFSSQGLTFVRK